MKKNEILTHAATQVSVRGKMLSDVSQEKGTTLSPARSYEVPAGVALTGTDCSTVVTRGEGWEWGVTVQWVVFQNGLIKRPENE